MSKKNKIVQLYPRPDFLSLINEHCADPSYATYVKLLLNCKNENELREIKKLHFLSNLDKVCSGKSNQDIHSLTNIWDDWSEFSNRLREFGFPDFSPSDDQVTSSINNAKSASTANEVGEKNTSDVFVAESKNILNEPVVDTYMKALGDLLKKQDDISNELELMGINYLPKDTTYAMKEMFQPLKDDLGFDIFRDLENYLAALDKALPQSSLSAIVTVENRDLVLLELIALWDHFANRFICAWTNSIDDVISNYAVELSLSDKKDLLETLGNLIFKINYISGYVAILGYKYKDEKYGLFGKMSHENVSERIQDEEISSDVVCEAFESFIDKQAEMFKKIGCNDLNAEVIVARAFKIVIDILNDSDQTDDDFYNSVDSILANGPWLLTGLRSVLLSFVTYGGETLVSDKGGIPLAAYSYRSSAYEYDGYRHPIENIFESIGLQQDGISDSDFLMASDVVISYHSYELGEDWWVNNSTREMFYSSQAIFKKCLNAGELFDDEIPDRVKSLGSLKYFGASDRIPSSDHISGIWALSVLMNEDSEVSANRAKNDRADTYLRTIKAMIKDGFIVGATHLFYFYLISQAMLVIYETKSRNSHDANTYMRPFGSWCDLNQILIDIKAHGFTDRTHKVLSYIATALEEIGHDKRELLFAARELLRYAGEPGGLVATKSSVEHFKLINLQNSDQITIKQRIVELIGSSEWDVLPEDVQNKILSIERSHDLASGDVVNSGEDNYIWYVSYIQLIEKLLKSKLNPMWNDVVLQGDVEEAYLSVSKDNKVPPKLTIGTAINLCEGIHQTGNKKLIEYCKKNCFDYYWVAVDLAKKLKPAVRLRNVIIHSDDSVKITRDEIELSRKNLLELLPKIIAHIGTSKKRSELR